MSRAMSDEPVHAFADLCVGDTPPTEEQWAAADAEYAEACAAYARDARSTLTLTLTREELVAIHEALVGFVDDPEWCGAAMRSALRRVDSRVLSALLGGAR